MRPPTGLRALAGTPAGTLIVAGAACLGPYAWYMSPNAWPLAVASLFVFGWVSQANQAVASYRAWKREWDGMAPTDRRLRVTDHPIAKFAVLGLAVIGLTAFLSSHPERPGYAFALNWLWGGLTCLIFGWLLVRRIRSNARPIWARKERASEAGVVTCAVGAPLLPVLSLTDAYRALPEHCWRTLDAR